MDEEARNPSWWDWVVVGIVLAALVVALLATVPTAKAHSWYDADCCSNHDCEPVQSVTYTAAEGQKLPVLTVTTSLGTKSITPMTKIRPSQDGRMHACIYAGVLWCLYMPPGN